MAEFSILFGKGISKASEIIELGVKLEVIGKSGAWYYYDGERLAQEVDNARAKLENDPELAAEIEAKIKEKMKDIPAPEMEDEDALAEDDEAIDIRVLDLGDDEDEAVPTALLGGEE